MNKVSTGSVSVVSGKKVSIGIDVHKDSWHVTVRTDGEEVFNGRIPAAYHSLMKLLERFKDCQMKVAYEAGPCGFSLHDKLMEDGIDTIVVPPSLIPIESGNRVKTDKRDSRKLAKLLESDMLKKVHVLTEEERMHRELIRTRRQLVDHRGSVARQIKSKLLFYDISSPIPEQIRMGSSLPAVVEESAVSIGILEGIPRYLNSSLRIPDRGNQEDHKERCGVVPY